MHLSKSRFTAGLQCHKQLWWKVHEPDAPELVASPAQQAVFDQGHRVGERAREEFPGGVLVDGCLRRLLLLMGRIPLQMRHLRHILGQERHLGHKSLPRKGLAPPTNSEGSKHP